MREGKRIRIAIDRIARRKPRAPQTLCSLCNLARRCSVALLAALVMPLVLSGAADAACGEAITFPAACVGETETATTTFCFDGVTACGGSGTVQRIDPPGAPFAITAIRREGLLATEQLAASDFPVTLAPLQSIAVDVAVSLGTSGAVGSRLTWVTSAGGHTDRCTVDLRASAPSCTDDACHLGTSCRDGACVPGAVVPCRDAGACDHAPDGQRCPDDGLACTDDVCGGSACLHVPIDIRCATSNACSAYACAPERDDHDAQGCVLAAGADTCSEDGDPCTDDTCSNDQCRHDAAIEHTSCGPITAAFRKALGLAAATRTLLEDMSAVTTAGNLRPEVTAGLVKPLQRIGLDLDTATQALAGKLAEPPGTPPPASDVPESPTQLRARIALAQLHGTPRRVGGFLVEVFQARVRAEVTPAEVALLHARARALRGGIRSLKHDLRAMQAVSRTFAR